jgi:hypothetical protein
MSVKFKRKKIDPQYNCGFYSHPEGTTSIGIHALDSDKWMTIEEIMEEHKNYYKDSEGVPPTWGELLRDLGTFICFHMVDVSVGEIGVDK